jgi:hypothetical protein
MDQTPKTGEIFYISELFGSEDELPEDIEDPDKYISIPHKNDLGLGKALVIEFTSQYLPGEIDRVYSIFSRKGAYSRYKELLEKKAYWINGTNLKMSDRKPLLINGAGKMKSDILIKL